MSRSLRRHHRERVKAKARAVQKLWGKKPNPRSTGKVADNLALCSGYCCGNQRQHEGPTRQEMLADGLFGEV